MPPESSETYTLKRAVRPFADLTGLRHGNTATGLLLAALEVVRRDPFTMVHAGMREGEGDAMTKFYLVEASVMQRILQDAGIDFTAIPG